MLAIPVAEYNIANVTSDIILKDLANIIANVTGTKLVFEIPDAIEVAGYCKATNARLDGTILSSFGWEPRYNIKREYKKR